MNRVVIISGLMALAWTTSARSSGNSPTTLPTVALEHRQSTDEFLARWNDERNGRLMQSAFWTLAHDYADYKHVQEVLRPVQQFLVAIANGDRSSLDPEAISAFKESVSRLLNDEEQAVRALAAILLGVCGDKSYAARLAALLEPTKITSGHFHYDRGRAAMALGLVGAREYTPQLINLLKSSNSFDRAGAAFGLGALRATDQREAIARLLDDADENVRVSATEALAMMGEMVNK